jgi:hypothetical protein
MPLSYHSLIEVLGFGIAVSRMITSRRRMTSQFGQRREPAMKSEVSEMIV